MKHSQIAKLVSSAFLVAAGTCFLLGAAVTVGDVMLRAVANKGVSAAIELTSLSIGFGALLSMPVCYAKRSHVTAKLLSEISPKKFAFPLGLLGSLASALFAGLLLWVTAENAISKLGSAETTADLGLPMSYAISVVALTLLACFAAALAGLWLNTREEGDL